MPHNPEYAICNTPTTVHNPEYTTFSYEGDEQYNRASGCTGWVLRLVLLDTVRMFRIQYGFAGQLY